MTGLDQRLTAKEQEFYDHVVEASTLILNGTYRFLSTYFDPYVAVVAFVRVAAVIASRSCTRRQLKMAMTCGLKEFDMIKAGTHVAGDGPERPQS